MRDSSSHLELVLFAVHDDSRDLLIHEDEDGGQQRRQEREERDPPGVLCRQGIEEPVSVLGGRLREKKGRM